MDLIGNMRHRESHLMTAGVHPNIHILIKMMAVWCYQKGAQSFLHYVVFCFDAQHEVALVTYIQPSLYVM